MGIIWFKTEFEFSNSERVSDRVIAEDLSVHPYYKQREK